MLMQLHLERMYTAVPYDPPGAGVFDTRCEIHHLSSSAMANDFSQHMVLILRCESGVVQ